jgi:hypothetical protein
MEIFDAIQPTHQLAPLLGTKRYRMVRNMHQTPRYQPPTRKVGIVSPQLPPPMEFTIQHNNFATKRTKLWKFTNGTFLGCGRLVAGRLLVSDLAENGAG